MFCLFFSFALVEVWRDRGLSWPRRQHGGDDVQDPERGRKRASLHSRLGVSVRVDAESVTAEKYWYLCFSRQLTWELSLKAACCRFPGISPRRHQSLQSRRTARLKTRRTGYISWCRNASPPRKRDGNSRYDLKSRGGWLVEVWVKFTDFTCTSVSSAAELFTTAPSGKPDGAVLRAS